MPRNICTTTAFNLEDGLRCDGHDADAVGASLADQLGIGFLHPLQVVAAVS